MKIIDRKTFLELPAGTVFSKYTAITFGDLSIRGESWPMDNDQAGDFVYVSLADAIDHRNSQEFMDKLDAARERGISLAMDFEGGTRDGLFDRDQLFAVFEVNDVRALIGALQATLPVRPVAQAPELASSAVNIDAPVNIVTVTYSRYCRIFVWDYPSLENAIIGAVAEVNESTAQPLAIRVGDTVVWTTPTTLMGKPDIFDFAKQQGVKVD